jgi:hypothetical protein
MLQAWGAQYLVLGAQLTGTNMNYVDYLEDMEPWVAWLGSETCQFLWRSVVS